DQCNRYDDQRELPRISGTHPAAKPEENSDDRDRKEHITSFGNSESEGMKPLHQIRHTAEDAGAVVAVAKSFERKRGLKSAIEIRGEKPLSAIDACAGKRGKYGRQHR